MPCAAPAAPAVPHVNVAALPCTTTELSGVQALQQCGVRPPSPTAASLQDAPRAQLSPPRSHCHQLQAAPRSCFSEPSQHSSPKATCPYSANIPPGATGCPSSRSQCAFCLKIPMHTFIHALACEQPCCGRRAQRGTAGHQLPLLLDEGNQRGTHTLQSATRLHGRDWCSLGTSSHGWSLPKPTWAAQRMCRRWRLWERGRD